MFGNESSVVSLFDFNSRFYRDDWIWISAEFTTEKHTRATHTHTHTHFKRREKPCQIPSNFHRSPLLLPVRTANRDSNGSNNAQKSFSFARRTTKTMTTTLSTLQKMEKRRTTIKRRRRERRGRRRSNNHRYSTRKYSN